MELSQENSIGSKILRYMCKAVMYFCNILLLFTIIVDIVAISYVKHTYVRYNEDELETLTEFKYKVNIGLSLLVVYCIVQVLAWVTIILGLLDDKIRMILLGLSMVMGITALGFKKAVNGVFYAQHFVPLQGLGALDPPEFWHFIDHDFIEYDAAYALKYFLCHLVLIIDLFHPLYKKQQPVTSDPYVV